MAKQGNSQARFGRLALGLRASLWFLAGLAVVPALVYSLWLCADARQQATENELLRADIALAAIVARQASLVAETRTLLLALAQSPVVAGSDRAACSAYLAGLLKDFSYYATLGVIEPDGWLGCSAISPAAPLRLSDRSWFRKAQETGDFAVGEHQVSRLTGKTTVNFALPLAASAPGPWRVVAAAVDLDWLGAELRAQSLPREASFCLFDTQGEILARMPSDAPAWDPSLLRSLATQAEKGRVAMVEASGQTVLFSYAPLPATGNGLFAAIGFPRQAALAAANAMMARHLVGVFCAVALAILCTWLGGEILVLRPARALAKATKALTEGDLSARVGLPPAPGELRALGAGFDAMAARLERDTARRREAESALRTNFELLDSLFAAFPNPVFHKDVQGRYQGCNQAFAEDVLGLPREKIIGRTLEELRERIPSSLAMVYHDRDLSLFESGGAQFYETPVRCADGRLRDFHLSKAVYRDAENRIRGLVGIMLDITRLKNYERDLTRRLARNAALTELSKAVIARMDSIEVFTRLVLAKARDLTDSPHGFVASIDPENGDMIAHTLTEMSPGQCLVRGESRRIRFPRNAHGRYDALWGHTLNILAPFYTNDPEHHPAGQGLPEGHIPIKRFLSAPAIFKGELMGQVALANADRPYTDEDREAVGELARLLAVALYRGRLEEGLRISLHEKEIMLREIHHRVKNNLQTISSLLGLQADQVADRELLAAFTETRNRIASMAQVHAELYAADDFAAIDLVGHVRNLTLRLLGSLGLGRDIGVSVTGEGVRLSLEQAIPASLVLNELVTNCFRHAFAGNGPGTVRIGIRGEGGQVTVTVRDDGTGLPSEFDLADPRGLGLTLATGLAGQLGGSLTATNDAGALFVLRFPVREMERAG